MLEMVDRANGWRGTATLLMLAMLVLLVLFLALRPLHVDSPASAGARAMLRLDGALGATVEPLDAALARREGLASGDDYLVVTSIASKGPAASAGLRVGDIIEQIDGKPADLMPSNHSTMPVTIWRHRKEETIRVQFGAARSG